ncbi:MAG: ATP-binding protein [Phototrophicaceae bacterium]
MATLQTLLTQSPGEFFFHLVVVLAFAAVLAMTLQRSRYSPLLHMSERHRNAAAGALLAWGVLLIGAVYARWTSQDARQILPPLESAAGAIAWLLIGWAFLTADRRQLGMALGLVLPVILVVLVIAYTLTGIQWPILAESYSFYSSTLGMVWSIVGAAIAGAIILLLIVSGQAVIDAPLKIVCFVLVLGGYGLTLWQIYRGGFTSDYSGFTRLSILVALPLWPYIVYRRIIDGYEQNLPVPATATPPTFTEAPANTPDAVPPLSNSARTNTPIERESVQLLRVIGLILEETKPNRIPLQIVKAAVEVLKADVGALLSIKDANYADVIIAYDRAMQRQVPAMLSLNLTEQPTLVNAIERHQQRPLFIDRNREELEDLYSRLDVLQVGPAYYQPLQKDNQVIAVLVIALPYTKRELREAEVEMLKGIGIISGSLFALSQASDEATLRAEERAIQAMIAGVPLYNISDSDIDNAHSELQGELEGVKQQNNALQRQVAQLRIELDDERTRLTHLLGDTEQGLSVSQRIVALNSEYERLRYEREQLARRLQEAETALATATAPDTTTLLQTEIETFAREKRELSAELDSLRAQLDQIRQSSPQPDAAQGVLTQMDAERQRIQEERDRLGNRLGDIETQLRSIGIEEGPAGLAQMVKQLFEQRSALQTKTDALQLERDALLNERKRLEQRIQRENARESQLTAAQAELERLSSDREAAARQREQLRNERNVLNRKLDGVRQQRAQLLADLSTYEDDLKQANERINTLEVQLQELREQRTLLQSEKDQLLLQSRALQGERDQVLTGLSGDRERLQQLNEATLKELQAVILDVTEQRNQLEAQLAGAERALYTLTAERQIQPAPIAPEARLEAERVMGMVEGLNSPMAAILGYVDMLVNESAGMLNEGQRKFVQRISANVVRLDTMIQDITHLTALESGQYALNRTALDLLNTIEDALTQANLQFREKDITLRLQLPDTLPVIQADANGIKQVISQLLTNAYMASPASSRVVIGARQKSLALANGQTNVVEVIVADKGAGIPSDALEDVFIAQLSPDRSAPAGLGESGIGLAIAKAIVEAHGGKMWLESQVGAGTVFHFALPISPTDGEGEHA